LLEEGATQRFAVGARERHRAISPLPAELQLVTMHAVGRRASVAVAAMATGTESQGDAIAGPQPLDPAADRLHDAGTLMTEHRRQPEAMWRKQVGVADSAGDQPDEDFVWPRIIERQ